MMIKLESISKLVNKILKVIILELLILIKILTELIQVQIKTLNKIKLFLMHQFKLMYKEFLLDNYK